VEAARWLACAVIISSVTCAGILIASRFTRSHAVNWQYALPVGSALLVIWIIGGAMRSHRRQRHLRE
jgi:uncharacterized membrane protein YfcA